MRFNEVKPALCKEILDGIDELGFTHMTPVQAATLPLFMTNKDVAVNATTGSGKTLAFVLPMIEMIRKRLKECGRSREVCKVMSIVLSPTRELARQIYDTAVFFFAKALPDVKVVLLVGGASVEENLQLLQENRGSFCVMIGTPGRTNDIMNRGNRSVFDLRDLDVLILDEADTLLDMGFQLCIDQILRILPKQRRTGLFSATQTQEVKALARAGLRNPATICVKVSKSEQQTPTTLNNFYTFVQPQEKLSHLAHFLKKNATKKAIVFFSTCAAVDFYGRALAHLLKDTTSVMLHGKMTPKKRNANYDSFVNLPSGVLFCTDIVARGIDLPDVDWIVQYDPPQDPNFFVHRVGRTARAGRSGCALTFLCPNEDTYVSFLSIRKIPIQEMKFDEVPSILPALKELVMTDRDFLERGTRAFIAYMRSYKEHQCQYIFRFADLDVGGVARGFCLLRLPKMKEFRVKAIDFEEAQVDVAQIKFKDKAREKQRQAQYAKLLEQRALEEEKFAERKEKRKKREEEEQEKAPRRREKKLSRHQQIVDEWDELAEEEMMYRKMKRGKISKQEYANILEGKENDPEGEKSTKMQKRFEKEPAVKQLTSEQKKERKKREERIRARKKQRGSKRMP